MFVSLNFELIIQTNSDILSTLGIGDGVENPSSISACNTAYSDMSASNSTPSATLADLNKVFSSNTADLGSFAPIQSLSSTEPSINTTVISNKFSADALLSGDSSNIPSLSPLPSCKCWLDFYWLRCYCCFS